MIASDCQRIVVVVERRHGRLRIHREELAQVVRTVRQIDGNGFVIDALQVQRDTHAERGQLRKNE